MSRIHWKHEGTACFWAFQKHAVFSCFQWIPVIFCSEAWVSPKHSENSWTIGMKVPKLKVVLKGRDVFAILPTVFGKSPFAFDSLLGRENCCCDHSSYSRKERSSINTVFDRNIIIIMLSPLVLSCVLQMFNYYIPSPLLVNMSVPRPSTSYPSTFLEHAPNINHN